MSPKTRRNTSPKQKPVTAEPAPGGINLCEVAERLELAKKEVRELLKELEGGSIGKEKLEAGLRELNDLITPVPPIHKYC